VLAREPGRLLELSVRHVDADHAAAGAGRAGCEEAVHARAAAEVDDGLAGADRGEVEVVADARERFDGGGRERGELLARRAEALGEAAAAFEVELLLGCLRDLAVHVLDALLELLRVERAGGRAHDSSSRRGRMWPKRKVGHSRNQVIV